MNVVIEKVQFATSQLVEALNRLLPQLSSDPPTLSIGFGRSRVSGPSRSPSPPAMMRTGLG